MREIGTKMMAIIIGLAIFASCISAVDQTEDGHESTLYMQGNEILDWYDLDNIRNNMSGNFVLMNDLDENTPGYDDVAGPGANAGAGWDPIGNYDPADPFEGTFDGQGYEIKDLYINRGDEFVVGLFAKIDGGAVIMNVGLVDVDITGDAATAPLVGITREGTEVIQSYVKGGSVTGVGNIEDYTISGLVAQNDATITDCYTSVNIYAADLTQIGGLVGANNGGTIRNSYAVGEVNGGETTGGLVGINTGGLGQPNAYIYDSFSDEEITGISNPIGDDSGTSENVHAYPTSTMQSYDTYESHWDIATIENWDGETWFIEDGVDYPKLFYQMQDPTLTINVEGNGTTDPEPGTHTYEWGESVTITAMPDAGYRFNNWLGDYPDSIDNVDKYNPEITVVVEGLKEISAYFVEEETKVRVVESQRGWDHETETHNNTDIEDGSLFLEPSFFVEDFEGVGIGEIPEGWNRTHEDWSVQDTSEAGGIVPELALVPIENSGSYQTRIRTHAVNTSGQTELEFSFKHYADNSGMFNSDFIVETSTDGETWTEVWSQSTSDGIGPEELSLSLNTDHGVGSEILYISWFFDGGRPGLEAWYIDDIVLGPFEGEREGTWYSLTWDTELEGSEIKNLEVETAIEEGQDIFVSIGVDTTDNGEIDSWSDWQELQDGVNDLEGDAFGLSSGYRYEVEYRIEAEHGIPRVLGYRLEVMEDIFTVDVEDITAGEQPYIEISEAVDEHDDPLEGDHNVTVTIHGESVIVGLTFTAGEANYTWDPMETSGEHVASVTIYEITAKDTFQVFTADAGSFEVYVDDITAGEHPVIEVSNAEDEFENPLEGVYTAGISIDGDSIITELMFSEGNATHTWDEMNITGEYEAVVDIDGIDENHAFQVFSGDADLFHVSVDDITAGEQPFIEIFDAEDEFGNILEGIYNVTIAINGDPVTVELEFSGGDVEYDYQQMTIAGEYTAVVTIDGTIESDDFSVFPEDVDEVIITPAPEAEVEAGADLYFTAEALDEYGNLITDNTTDFVWINATEGVFNKETIGEYEVNATYEGVTSNTTTITVVSAGAHDFQVSVDDITAGERPLINITDAEDEFGNVLNGTYSAAIAVNGDLVTVDIEFNEGDAEHEYDQMTTAGEYTADITIDEVLRSDNFTIYVGSLDHVLITPETTTITAGETQTYTAVAYDEFGNEIEDVTADTAWSIHEDAGGSWDNNTYTSQFAGTWTVYGTYEEVVYEAELTVIPGDAHTVEISPDTEQTVEAGETLDFSAAAYDEYGNLITDDDFYFIWSGADVSGMFLETEVGTYDVSATYGGVTSTAVMVTVVPGDAHTVEISPDTEQTVEAGESMNFSAAAYDEYGNLITDDDSNFTWSGADVSGMFLETEVGTYDVSATYDGITSTAVTVTVVPGDAHTVEISPDTEQTVEAGETLDFSAAAYDEYGNLITDDDSDFTWSGADVSGMFLETEVGTYDVTATYDGVTSTAVTVTVVPGAAYEVEISPDTEQTAEAGETLEFSAAAYDEFANLITDDAADFTWSGADASGMFLETVVGTYDVTAAYDGVTSTAVTVTVIPG
ncbi:MAG: hypothetical protein R6U17_01755, partial [Thermoplasmata archaeon]